MLLKDWCYTSFDLKIKCNISYSGKNKFLSRSLKFSLDEKYRKLENFKKLIFLNWEIKLLPSNVNFEIIKSIERIKSKKIKKIIFQFPEGFHVFFRILNRILTVSINIVERISISNTITYGACCVEDSMGESIGFDLLIHYGHSCLVPVSNCFIPVMYIFLEIKFDFSFLIENLKCYFFLQKNKILSSSTIQFVSSLKHIKKNTCAYFKFFIPKNNRPLSPGEVLGCTGYEKKNFHTFLYLGDGRFHLESIIISNFNGRFLQFNPYCKTLSIVGFKTLHLLYEREKSLKNSLKNRENFGYILSSLGRQSGTLFQKRLLDLNSKSQVSFAIAIMGEINFDKLEIIGKKFIGSWVQVACPRLSLDWSHCFKKSILTTFEISVILGLTKWKISNFPMDYYKSKSGFWSNYSKIESLFKFNLNNIKPGEKKFKRICQINERK
jgi:2-(3-amino-3-carboxypropyl)histidine synthase